MSSGLQAGAALASAPDPRRQLIASGGKAAPGVSQIEDGTLCHAAHTRPGALCMSLTSANLVGYLRVEFAKASRLRVWLFFLQLATAVPAAVAVLIPDHYGDALYLCVPKIGFG